MVYYGQDITKRESNLYRLDRSRTTQNLFDNSPRYQQVSLNLQRYGGRNPSTEPYPDLTGHQGYGDLPRRISESVEAALLYDPDETLNARQRVNYRNSSPSKHPDG